MDILHRLNITPLIAIFALFLGLLMSWGIVYSNPIYVLGLSGLILLSIGFLESPKITTLFLIMILPIIRGFAESTRLFSGSAYTVNILGILNIFIPIMVAIYLFVHHRKFSSFKLSKPITLFTMYLLLGILFSVSPFITLRECFRIVMPISLYFIILCFEIDGNQAKKFLYVILLSSIVPMLIGGYQYINKSCIYEGYGINRLSSTFGHPNCYAMFLVICILITSYLYSSRNWFMGKMVFISYLACLFFSLFNTFTRIGWATSLFSLSILGMLGKKRLIFFIFSVLIIMFLLIPNISNLFLERIKPDSSAMDRLVFNKFSLSLFTEKPSLGIGLGNYGLLSEERFGIAIERYGKAFGVAPHNDYLKFLVETGLIGLLLYLYLMYSALRIGIRLCKSDKVAFKNYGIFLISLILGILFFGITDSGFTYSWIYLWIILAIGEVHLRSLEKSKPNLITLKE